MRAGRCERDASGREYAIGESVQLEKCNLVQPLHVTPNLGVDAGRVLCLGRVGCASRMGRQVVGTEGGCMGFHMRGSTWRGGALRGVTIKQSKVPLPLKG